jgi:lipopolysaccharide transport system permease protein
MKKKEVSEDWNLIIVPQTALFHFDFQEIWRYRDLLWLLVRRDFVSFYKQTILGPLWFFIQPVFTTITFTFIFGNLAGLSTDGLPQPLFYMTGIAAWNYFADCLTKTSTVFRDNSNIFSKVYFPRLIMPLSIVVSNLARLFVQIVLLLCVMFFYYLNNDLTTLFRLNLNILFIPVIILMMAMLGLGLGLIITALTTKYRDLSFLITFGVQLMMYSTTVIFPLSSAPQKYKWIIEMNPMTGIIEAFRYCLLGNGVLTFYSFGYSVVIAILSIIVGILIFNKTEKTFVDTI